jgi:hypothetical protein
MTVQKEQPKEQHDTKKLERQLTEIKRGFLKLADERYYTELRNIIHGPGWTTLAEFKLTTAVVDSIQGQIKVLDGLQQELLAGARAVTAK